MTSRKQEGFRVTRRTATIDFAEDSPWHGVEASVVISVPFETLFWFQRNASSDDPESSLTAIKRFGDDYLMEWNVQDEEGNPYPATGDGLSSVDDTGLVTSLMSGWIEAVVTPPDPLSVRSGNTDSSAEALIAALEKQSTPLGS